MSLKKKLIKLTNGVNKMDDLNIPMWMKIINEIDLQRKANISILAKKTDITYSHVYVVSGILLDYDLVTIEKNGRVKDLCLTEKGERVANAISVIGEVLINRRSFN